MLEARSLTKKYNGLTALNALNLQVSAGEIYGLLGANGAGKSTTIKLFLGFIAPDEGQALIGGMDVQAEPTKTKALVAYIPENVMMYGMLNAYENIDYFAKLAGHGAYVRTDYDRFFDRVGLDKAGAERRVETYSKGMRQKVGIAIALAKQARALLLDEPTSGLDPRASNEFSQLIRGLAKDGAAILMATHDLFRAKEDATRIGIMKHGMLVDQIAPADISHADVERLYLKHMHD